MMKLSVVSFLFLTATSGCEVNSDCSKYEICESGTCTHKELFPLDVMEVIGTAAIFICSALANAAGQGGGPLMTLILLTIFLYQPDIALPMVQLIILGGSGIGFLLRVSKRHPTRKRPLIDYYLLVLLTSPLLFGSSIGVILSQIFPYWLILALLTLVLIYITFTSAQISIKIFRKENVERASKGADRLLAEEDLPSVIDETSVEITPDLKRIINSEKHWFPLVPCLIFVSLYAFAVLASFFRGSAGNPSIIGVSQCSLAYWLMTMAIFVLYILFTLATAYYIMYTTRQKVNLGYDFDSYDLIWTWKPIKIFIAFGVIAGIGASLLSFGGALILGPVMLRLGVRPEVSAGTSTAIIVVTSSISIIQYSIAGKLELIYGVWFFGFSLMGSAVGIGVIKAIVNKLKRGSIMVITLTVLMGLCAVLVPVNGIIDLSTRTDISMGFIPYCN